MKLKDFIRALLGSIAIMISYPVMISIINGSFPSNFNFLLFTFIFIVLLLIKKRNIYNGEKVLSLLFSLFLIIGEIYYNNLSLTFISKYFLLELFIFFKFFGYYFVLNIMFSYLNIFLDKFKLSDLKPKNRFFKWYLDKLYSHPFMISFMTIFIFWLIYLIAFYPMVLSKDPSFQILQYYNLPNKYADYVIQRDPNVFMTNHHPIILTFMLGKCIDLGRYVLNDNFGLFLFTFIQTIIYISSLSFSIYYLKKRNINVKYLFLLTLIYSLVPMFPFYALCAVKDTIYTSLMIYFVIFIYDIINDGYSLKKGIWLTIISILLSLFRNNGIYVVLGTLMPLIIYLRGKLTLSLVITVMFMFVFNKIFIPSLGVSDGSIREALSVPFQNTARYYKYYPNDLSKKDRRVIDHVLDISDLSKRYNPDLSDPVKGKYNKFATRNDLKDYFVVWVNCFKRHPLVYVDSFLNNTYGYIYPNVHKWYIYDKPVYIVNNSKVLNYHLNDLVFLRLFLSGFAYVFLYIPIIGLISSIGFNTWVLIFVTYFLLHKKRYKELFVLVPLYISLMFCFLGPANTYFRYAMPYIYPMFLLIILFRWDNS